MTDTTARHDEIREEVAAAERRQQAFKLASELLQAQQPSPPCVFQTNLDTDSTRSWTVIPRQAGHRFQSKLDSQP